jgi:DNA-binding IclR family transcriptional regulator
MKTLPYRQALERIQGEYLEMPGLRLTPTQVERLSGLDRATCTRVLEDLVRTKFLYVGPDKSYARFIDSRLS